MPIPDRPSIKLGKDTKELIKREINYVRWTHSRAHEFPFESHQPALEDLINSTLNPEYLKALLKIWDDPYYKKIIRAKKYTHLAIDDILLIVRTPDDMPYQTCQGVKADENHPQRIRTDNPYYHKLKPWAQDMHALKQKSFLTGDLVDSLLNQCNTSGQLLRVWPEIINYMPDKIAHKIAGATRASRIPPGIDMLWVNDIKSEVTEYLAFMALVRATPRLGEVRVRVA